MLSSTYQRYRQLRMLSVAYRVVVSVLTNDKLRKGAY